MSSNPLIYIIPPSAPHSHTIILLHGRGSDASTFQSELFESQDSHGQCFPDTFPSVKWVFPCAKLRWAETDQEYIRQWFDMTSVQRPWENIDVQKEGLRQSSEQLEEVINAEIKEIGWERVIVGGLSQGCAVGLYTLLDKNIKIAGFFGMSGWLPTFKGEGLEICHVKDWPIMLQHCKDDQVVPIANGEEMAKRLAKLALKVEWQCFEEGGHWLNEPEGMDGIVQFIIQIMARPEVQGT